MSSAVLTRAVLDRACLWRANLKRVSLDLSFCRETDFAFADLEGAYLDDADVSGAFFHGADLTRARTRGIIYRKHSGLTWIPLWPFRRDIMLGRYLGIQGVDSCYGSPSFRRDALDQDFIDAKYFDARLLGRGKMLITKRFDWLLNAPLIRTLRGVKWNDLHRRIPRRILFLLWSITDYGRSVAGVLFFAAAFILAFGALYQCILLPQHDVTFGATLAEQPDLPFRAWFAAAMGAATLGLTDLIHPRTVLGEAAMIGNVLSGLVTFGTMIAVLQNKFARRS